MVKKVRFNDEVQINQMSINLAEHIKEIKLAEDIIIDPDKIVSKEGSSEKKIKKFGLWSWLLVLVLTVLLFFILWNYFRNRLDVY